MSVTKNATEVDRGRWVARGAGCGMTETGVARHCQLTPILITILADRMIGRASYSALVGKGHSIERSFLSIIFQIFSFM